MFLADTDILGEVGSETIDNLIQWQQGDFKNSRMDNTVLRKVADQDNMVLWYLECSQEFINIP